MKFVIWDADREVWEPFSAYEQYDEKWWFEIIPGAWGNIVYAHTKTIAGHRFHIWTHPTLPGKYLGYYCEHF